MKITWLTIITAILSILPISMLEMKYGIELKEIVVTCDESDMCVASSGKGFLSIKRYKTPRGAMG